MCTCTDTHEESCDEIRAHLTRLAERFDGDAPIFRSYVAGIQAGQRCQRAALVAHARAIVE